MCIQSLLAGTLLLVGHCYAHPRKLQQPASTVATTLTGRVNLNVAENWKDPPKHSWFFTNDNTGERMPINWGTPSGMPPSTVRSTQRVTISGVVHRETKSAQLPVAAAQGSASGVRTASVEAATLTVRNVTILDEASTREQARALQVDENAVVQLNVAVFMVDFSACDSANGGPANTVDQVRAALFDNVNPTTPTVESVLRSCSHGRTAIDANRSAVFVVKMRSCSGITPWGSTWRFNDCPNSSAMDFFSNVVETQAMRSGIDLRPYTHRWHIISKSQGDGPNCNWGGMATVGCGSRGPTRSRTMPPTMPVCRTMIWYGYFNEVYPWLHEIGHNLGNYHAAANGDEYGDSSSIMGGWGNWPYTRCFNLPHAMQIGAARPYIITASSIRGTWSRFVVTTAARSINNAGIRVNGVDMPNNFVTSAFISYRTVEPYTNLMTSNAGTVTAPHGGDLNLDPSFAGVLVHTMPDLGGNPRSMLNLRMSPDPWTAQFDPATGLVVYIGAVDQQTGQITLDICRRVRQGNGQFAAWDQDPCNGLDDDCSGVVDQGCPNRRPASVTVMAPVAGLLNNGGDPVTVPVNDKKTTAPRLQQPPVTQALPRIAESPKQVPPKRT